jgi:hypothetical protein
MSIFTALCKSRNIKLHAVLWILSLVILFYTLTSIGVVSTTKNDNSKNVARKHEGLISLTEQKEECVASPLVDDVVSVSSCKSSKKQETQEQHHYYELHFKIPANCVFDFLFSSKFAHETLTRFSSDFVFVGLIAVVSAVTSLVIANE